MCQRKFLDSHYSNGGVIVVSAINEWFSLEIDFAKINKPKSVVSLKSLHLEPLCNWLSFVTIGNKGYWLAWRGRINIHGKWIQGASDCTGNDFPSLKTHLVIAEDCDGIPGQWRSVAGAEEGTTLPVSGSAGLWPWAKAGFMRYDDTHAITLLHCEKRTCICLLDVANAKIVQAIPVRIVRGYWHVCAWDALPDQAGGTIWLHTNNEKLSARHRDATIWRISYGATAKNRAKKGTLPVHIERITSERVVTRVAVLNYPDYALILWNHGLGIKHVDPMRCVLYPRGDGSFDQPAHDVSALAEKLPQRPAGETQHMGRMVNYPAQSILPKDGLTFAGRNLMRLPVWKDSVSLQGYMLLEIPEKIN